MKSFDEEALTPEVTLYFADALHRGNRAVKLDASGLKAFGSPNLPPLATMGISCSVRWDLVRPPSPGRFRLMPDFDPNLVIIRVFPGPFTTLRNTLQPPLKGAILQTFGAGNAPDRDADFLDALREASSRGLVIVNVTQCSAGSVEPAYATGQSLAAAGVVAGGDMTPEAALVKLGWLLGCGLAPEEVRRMMGTDLRGEVTNRQAQRFSLSDGGFLRRVFSAASLESVAQADPSAAAPPPSSLAEGEARLQETSPLDGLLAEGGKEALRDGLSRAASAPHSLDGGLADYSGLPALRRALVPTLLCAAAGNGDMQAMLALVADGAVLRTSRDYDGRTPLHLASSEGRDAVVAYLLQPEHGIPLSALDRHDNTPLADACKFRHRRAVALLVAAGARLGLRPLRLAGILCALVKARDYAGLECYVAARADVSAADHSGTTPLHVAAVDGDVRATATLLSAGANPAATDRWGRTPWHEASDAAAGGARAACVMPRTCPCRRSPAGSRRASCTRASCASPGTTRRAASSACARWRTRPTCCSRRGRR
uniref:asparaginase n=2 Tax=Emiliania huxleyi TaxID=2903 RepID=A0A7S3TTU6_EMIHU